MFKAEPVDQYGNLIDRHNLWEMVGVRYRRSLFPGFSDTAEYSFPLLGQRVGAAPAPRSRVTFRFATPRAARARADGHGASSLPQDRPVPAQLHVRRGLRTDDAGHGDGAGRGAHPRSRLRCSRERLAASAPALRPHRRVGARLVHDRAAAPATFSRVTRALFLTRGRGAGLRARTRRRGEPRDHALARRAGRGEAPASDGGRRCAPGAGRPRTRRRGCRRTRGDTRRARPRRRRQRHRRRAHRAAPGVTFTEVAESVGLRFTHFAGRRSTQLPEDMGSGLAWGDYDGDGWPDLFVVNESGPLTMSAAEVAASPAHARLFHNVGGRFVDVTEQPRASPCAAWAWARPGATTTATAGSTCFVTRYGTERCSSTTKATAASATCRRRRGSTASRASGRAHLGRLRPRRTARPLRVRLRALQLRRREGEPRRATSSRRRCPYTLNPSSYPPERNLLLHNVGGRFVERGPRGRRRRPDRPLALGLVGGLRRRRLARSLRGERRLRQRAVPEPRQRPLPRHQRIGLGERVPRLDGPRRRRLGQRRPLRHLHHPLARPGERALPRRDAAT